MKKRTIVSAALWAAALLCALLPKPWLAERVSRPLLKLLGRWSAGVPFPIAEPLVIALIALFAIALAAALIRCVTLRRASPLARFALDVAMVTGALTLLYLIVWFPVARTSALATPTPAQPRQALFALCERLTEQADGLRALLPDALDYKRERIPEAARLAIGAQAPAKLARYPEWMDALGIAGMLFPFTGEAILDPGEPVLTLPFAAVHELAHQLGYGREDEANYAAYRACLNGDPFFRYSGTMYALHYAMNALRLEDSAAWLAQMDAMSPTVRREHERMGGYPEAEIPERMARLNRVSEAFLRLSGQDGLKSYGKMVDLLLMDVETP